MKASQKTVVKISASDYYYMVKGKVLKLESDSTMGALSGTVLQDTNNIFVFMIDENGNTTTRMGTGAAALSNVVWPVTPSDQAIVGLVIISPVGGNFIGGTTALDDVTVVPNAVFINFTHTVDPTTKPF